MERKKVAAGIADDLFAAEDAIDQALSRTAALLANMAGNRRRANISAVVGQEMFDTTLGVIAGLTDSRRQIIATHHNLATVRDKIGLRHVSFGPIDKPDEYEPRGLAPLRVVPDEQAA